MDFVESAIITQPNSLPICDLKLDEILSTIFGYLKLKESTGKNNELNPFTCASFHAKCRNETVMIDDSGFVRSKYIILGEQLSTVSEIETATFLRVCGHLVSKLQIDYSNRSFLDDTSDFDGIERAVAHYCADSLAEIELLSFDSRTFNAIDQSFSTVTTVAITDGYFEQCLSKLCQWFPNVEHLLLENNTFSDPKHIEVAFPNLKQLTLKHNRLDQLGHLTRMNIANCLRANVQLQRLSLMASNIAMDTQILSCINNTLPGLMDLTFELFGKENFIEGCTIDFEALKKLTVHLPPKRQCQAPMSAVDIEELWLIGYSASNVQWTHFITKCTKLVKLMLLTEPKIMTKSALMGNLMTNEEVLLEENLLPTDILLATENLDETLMLFAKSLPNLTVLHVSGDFISTPSHLNRFVAECETLHTLDLGFEYSDQIVRESFATVLGNDWEAVIHEPHIDYHRITLKY